MALPESPFHSALLWPVSLPNSWLANESLWVLTPVLERDLTRCFPGLPKFWDAVVRTFSWGERDVHTRTIGTLLSHTSS